MKIISGGQTGVDQIGLQVGRALGYETGGTAPRGWQTDDGPAEDLLRGYGLVECRFKGYAVRTQFNVRDADLTVWFGRVSSPGGIVTEAAARRLKKPFLVNPSALELREAIATIGVTILNVAGNRQRKNPPASVEAYHTLCTALAR